jgi:excisionase family DNA binding protein
MYEARQIRLAVSPVPPELRLYTKHEVADLFHLVIRRLEEMMRRGEIGYVRIGRLVRFRLADIKDCVAGETLVEKKRR